MTGVFQKRMCHLMTSAVKTRIIAKIVLYSHKVSKGTCLCPLFYMEHITTKNTIQEFVINFLKEEFGDGYFFISADLSSSNLLRIYIDGINAVDFAVCRKVSRGIEAFLDENLLLGEKYKLEVSSPGIDKPLTDKRQFAKHKGRKVKVTSISKNVFDGKLVEVTEDMLTLETKNNKQQDIQLTDVESVKVEISFK